METKQNAGSGILFGFHDNSKSRNKKYWKIKTSQNISSEVTEAVRAKIEKLLVSCILILSRMASFWLVAMAVN